MVWIVFVFWAATAITSPAQTLTTLYSFCPSGYPCPDGEKPYAGLVQGTDGNFYGTTSAGGVPEPNNGTVFKITPSGTLTTLYKFCSLGDPCPDGAVLFAGLVQATDGNFYGTTVGGGTNVLDGTIFRITPSGTLTTLYSFCHLGPPCADGDQPVAGLVQATDGNFYGTTSVGGGSGCGGGGCGTVFKITPSGTLTTLHSFDGADGVYPAGLVQATDGNFYGTTTEGGASNPCVGSYTCGTVFKITPSGAFTLLHSFNGADGFWPSGFSSAALVEATDGNLYGTTFQGGANDYGTVFKITAGGTLTTLYNFCSQPNCSDGVDPIAGLVQATDGNFYGTASEGGGNGPYGTLFKIAPSGTLTTLYHFCSQPNCADGSDPIAGLVQATDGNFYGTTYGGGDNGYGTVFSLSGPNPSPVQLVPVTPCRLVDTRQTHDPIQGGTWQDFVVPQLGGCNIPTTAAYSLNVTVVPHEHGLGYLTIWPAGKSQPLVSTMNSPDGRIKANAAIVPAGASGAVSVYATDTTDVILDIDGYFATPSSETSQFYPLTPCRLVDTRGAQGNLGGPRLQAQTPRSFPLLQSTCVPSGLDIKAYSLNFTVVPNPSGQQLGYLTVWPTGESQPTVSTLNNPTATVVANAAIVPAGTNGAVEVYAYSTTDLLIDIDGYFAAPGTGGFSMYPVAPCRVLDTRQNNGQPFSGEKTVNVVGSPCAPPSSAKAYVLNATVVPPGSMPYLTLWPNGEQQPVVSTLNADDGFITSNMAIVPTNNGSIDAYAYALTQLILDISGYFAP
jgi:uncharacterized repeat protein (TIGR03803 family)